MPAVADRATTNPIPRPSSGAEAPVRRVLAAARAAARGSRRVLAIPFAFALALALAPRAARADDLVVVAPGETLSRLAAANGTTVAAIVARNGLPSADLIYPGQRLLIPGGRAAPDDPPDPVAAARDAVEEDLTHTVLPGETVFAIALAYHVRVREIVVANGLGRADFVYAGQSLRIPGAHRRAQPDAASTEGRIAIPGTADRADEVGTVAAEDSTADGGTETGSAADLGGSRSIVIDLSDQTLSAYAGTRLVNRFIVSSGSAWTPTPLGAYAVYSRYVSQRMVGPGYDLPGVPFVQYFTGSYAIHGAYWHQNFGVPVSHGCVNLQPGDAAWLWEWAAIGTPVTVQP